MSRFIGNTNYHTAQGLDEEFAAVVEGSKTPVEAVELGRSVEGRPITAYCFGDGDFRKPEILYFALAHAIEFIGAETALEIARGIAAGDAGAALDRMNVWVLPVFNPDGYAKVERQLSSGPGIGLARSNANGVDLNRNFPVAFYHLPRSIFSGSPFKISPYYRGAEPCSETESAVFRDFIIGRNFKTSLSLHSFGGSILFPYSHTSKKCRDYDAFMALGGEMASRQSRPYTVKPAYKLYQMNGDMDDWLYDECGVFAMVMEIGRLGVRAARPETWLNPFFWSNPVEPHAEIDNILPACLYLVEYAAEKFAGPK
jgi:carboxypeptidase T